MKGISVNILHIETKRSIQSFYILKNLITFFSALKLLLKVLSESHIKVFTASQLLNYYWKLNLGITQNSHPSTKPRTHKRRFNLTTVSAPSSTQRKIRIVL